MVSEVFRSKLNSKKFRLFDYWQPPGSSIEQKKATATTTLLDETNELEAVDVTSTKYKGRATMPPKSEIRLDFMDEWEYAQDVSYIHTPNDNWMLNKVADTGDIFEDIDLSDDETARAYTQYDYVSEFNYKQELYGKMSASVSMDKWRSHGWEGPRHHAYTNVLTAYEVLQSAFWRHNYNWAYWVKMIVTKGEYNSEKVPIPDFEYLKGKDPIKMMNFKEIVIRSDEAATNKYINENWNAHRSRFLNKNIYRSFYFGFLLRASITPQDNKQIDGYPGHTIFRNQMARRVPNIGIYKQYKDYEISQKMYPEHPNYVACFILNKEEDKVIQGIIPKLAVKTTRRYTRVQGYNESKRFYSPDYTNNKPDEKTKDYRRTLFWEANATVGDDGCITVELHNNSKESILLFDATGVDNGNLYITR